MTICTGTVETLLDAEREVIIAEANDSAVGGCKGERKLVVLLENHIIGEI